jgi:hypothetical protein
LSAPEYVTFQEKNFLVRKENKPSPSKRLTNIRRKSLGESGKSSKTSLTIYASLEQEIKQLELKSKSDATSSSSSNAVNINSNNTNINNNNSNHGSFENIKSKIMITNSSNVDSSNAIDQLNYKKSRVHIFENRLAQIGKLEKKIDMPMPNRSSTPDEKTPNNQLKLNK